MKYLRNTCALLGGWLETLFDSAFSLIPGSSSLLGAAYHRVYDLSPLSSQVKANPMGIKNVRAFAEIPSKPAFHTLAYITANKLTTVDCDEAHNSQLL